MFCWDVTSRRPRRKPQVGKDCAAKTDGGFLKPRRHGSYRMHPFSIACYAPDFYPNHPHAALIEGPGCKRSA